MKNNQNKPYFQRCLSLVLSAGMLLSSAGIPTAANQATQALVQTLSETVTEDQATKCQNGYKFTLVKKADYLETGDEKYVEWDDTTTFTPGSGTHNSANSGEGGPTYSTTFTAQAEDTIIIVEMDTEQDNKYFNSGKTALNESYIGLNCDATLVWKDVDYHGVFAGIIVGSDSSTVYLNGENSLVSNFYPVDIKSGATLTFDEDPNAETGSIFIEKEVSSTDNPAIRLNDRATFVLDGGEVVAICRGTTSSSYSNAGIGYASSAYACGSVEVNGGRLLAVGSVGIGGRSFEGLTVKGGEVYAIGSARGIGGTNNDALEGDIVINGGYVYAQGSNYAVFTGTGHDLVLNGGVLEAIGINGSSSIVGQGIVAKGDGAVLIRNNSVPLGNQSDWNLIDILANGNQLDPFSTYYGTSNVSTVSSESDEETTWYGRVYGRVELKEPFTLGARDYTTSDFLDIFSFMKSYVDELTFSGQGGLSTDKMLLDIPPENSFRHSDGYVLSDDEANSVKSYLTIEEGSTLRFKGEGLDIGTKVGGSNDYTKIASSQYASEDVPFFWQSGTLPPHGDGEINVILSNDMIGAYSFGSTLNTVESDIEKAYIKDGKIEYGDNKVMYLWYREAGNGNLWYNSLGGIAYVGNTNGVNLGSATVLNTSPDIRMVDTYTVTIRSAGTRTWQNEPSGNYGVFFKGVGGTGIDIVYTDVGYGTFEVTPFDIAKQIGVDGDEPRLEVDYGDSLSFTIDMNDQLGILDNVANLMTVTAIEDDNSKTTLKYGRDFDLAYKYISTTDVEGTAAYEINLVIQGLGNYMNSFTDEVKTFVAQKSDGKIDGMDVQIQWSDEESTPVIYVKPDGTIDLSDMKMYDVTGDESVEIPFGEPYGDANITYTATPSGSSSTGSLQYVVTIKSTTGNELTFTVTAEAAGTGDRFDAGYLNLVDAMYCRPDCNLYPEDFALYGGTVDAKTLLTNGVDYVLYIHYKHDADDDYHLWDYPVDCHFIDSDEDGDFTISVGNLDSKPDDEDYITFDAIWKAGGDGNFGFDISTGILHTYEEDSTDEAVYVSRGYGAVLSADKLEIDVSTYEYSDTASIGIAVIAGDDDDDKGSTGTMEQTTVLLNDSDIAFLSTYAEFKDYVADGSINRTTLEYRYRDEDGVVHTDFLENRTAENYFTLFTDNINGTDTTSINNAINDLDTITSNGVQLDCSTFELKDITWHLTLVAKGNYTGQLEFQVPQERLKFLDILEQIVGVLEDQLVINPNLTLADSNTKIYQKPDGELHLDDYSIMKSVLPYLNSSYELTEHTVSNYTISATAKNLNNLSKTETATIAGITFTGVPYSLSMSSTTTSNEVLKEVYGTSPDEVKPILYVESAGTGETYRHGYIDLVEVQTVDYVVPTGTEDTETDDGKSITTTKFYTQDDLGKVLLQLEFYHGGKLISPSKYTVVLNDTFYGYDLGELSSREGDAYSYSITLTQGSDSVTFNVPIQMEKELEGQIYYYSQGAILKKDDFATTPVPMSEPFPFATTTPTRTHYTFEGWSVDVDGTYMVGDISAYTSISDLVAYANDNNSDNGNYNSNVYGVVLYAQWKAVEYTVNFDVNGGAALSSGTEESKGQYSQIVQFPSNPTRSGYYFLGWATTNSAEKAMETDSLAFGALDYADNAVTLYAVWEAMKDHHIYFDWNYSGVGVNYLIDMGNEEKLEPELDTPIDFPSSVIRQGYQLNVWALVAEETGLNSSNTLSHTVDPDYVEPDEETPEVEDESEDDEDIEEDTEGDDDDTTDEGDEDTDEDTTDEGTSTSESTEEESTEEESTEEESTEEESTETVSFSVSDHSTVKSNSTFYLDLDVYTPVISTLSAIFTVTESISVPSHANGVSTYRALDFVEVSKDIKAEMIYGHWEANTYTVNFVSENSTFDTKIVTWTEEINLKNFIPTREGYIFGGWKVANTVYTDYITVSQMGVDDTATSVSLVAEWVANPAAYVYTVIFIDTENKGHTITHTDTVAENTVEFPNVVLTGHTISEWQDTASAKTYLTSNTYTYKDMDGLTLKSIWVEIPKDEEPEVTPPADEEDEEPETPEEPEVTPPVVTPPTTGGNNSSSGSSSGSTSSTVTNLKTHSSSSKQSVEVLLSPSTSGNVMTHTLTSTMANSIITKGNSLGSSFDVVLSGNSSATAGKTGNFYIAADTLALLTNSNMNSLSVQFNDVVLTFDKSATEELMENVSTGLTLIVSPTDDGELIETNRPFYQVGVLVDGVASYTGLLNGWARVQMPFNSYGTEGNILGGRWDGEMDYCEKSYYDGSNLAVLFQEFGTYGVVLRDSTDVFHDLEGSWAEEFVNYMDARRFYSLLRDQSVDNEITRGMFVTILGLLEEIDVSEYRTMDNFTDVSSNSAMAPYIEWANASVIACGVGSGKFNPDAPISREEISMMLMQYVNNLQVEFDATTTSSSFSDQGDISSWATEAVQYAQEHGIVAGREDNSFDPKATTTYGEHGAMLVRLIENLVDTVSIYLS